MQIPDYVGASSFGLKMGVVLPGSDLQELIMERMRVVNNDGLLHDKDVLCVTESVVARSQNNYVTTNDTAEEVKSKLNLDNGKKVGVLFPIASRNRFSLIMEGIARAVPDGEVVVQLSYPRDEVGNQIISEELANEITSEHGGVIDSDKIDRSFAHPITGVDYVQLYKDIITENGAKPVIILSNDPLEILNHQPEGVIVADIHTKEKHHRMLESRLGNCCTLQEFFGEKNGPGSGKAWSEFGLLGSNMSSQGRLKLAPYRAEEFAVELQDAIKEETGKNVEVIVYGDGAYKDPSSSIYELADPYPAFGATPGVRGVYREGVKYKYLVDLHHDQGKSETEIESELEKQSAQKRAQNDIAAEGTTPRRMEDVLASLADLVSGSADAGTPLVLIKGIY